MRFLLLLPFLASTALAQIEVPEKVELGQPIVASVTLPEGGRVAWKAGPGVSAIDAGDGKAYLWAKPGKARIEAVVVAVKDGQLGALEWLEATFEVIGSAPQPTPPPTPTPGPTPPPAPSGKRVVYVVYESAQLTPQMGMLFNDLMVGPTGKALISKGHTAQTRDKDSLPDKIKEKLGVLPSLPVVFILDAATSNVLNVQPLPTDGAAILQLVTQSEG